MKKTVKDVEVKGKKVIVRCDFNVPMEEGGITDDRRIVSALPTINYLMREGAAVILMSHMGRPGGKPVEELSLMPVAERLSRLIGKKVTFFSKASVLDEEVKRAAKALKSGEVMLLENLRFRKEETDNDDGFAEELAGLGDIFVNDAFGTAHRAHCSTVGITKYIPGVSGFLIEREMEFLGQVMQNPQKPLLAVMGGAKVGDKIPVIDNLMKSVDVFLICGGMAFTFLKVMGVNIGKSLLEPDMIQTAKDLMIKADRSGVDFILPVDIVCGGSFSNDTDVSVFGIDSIPSEMMGLDIGPKTIKLFEKHIKDAETIVWNGPAGAFEMPKFESGTKALCEMIARSRGTTIIGGGDSAAAVEKYGLAGEMTHISTGGGASLELLEGKELPGIAVLEEMV